MPINTKVMALPVRNAMVWMAAGTKKAQNSPAAALLPFSMLLALATEAANGPSTAHFE